MATPGGEGAAPERLTVAMKLAHRRQMAGTGAARVLLYAMQPFGRDRATQTHRRHGDLAQCLHDSIKQLVKQTKHVRKAPRWGRRGYARKWSREFVPGNLTRANNPSISCMSGISCMVHEGRRPNTFQTKPLPSMNGSCRSIVCSVHVQDTRRCVCIMQVAIKFVIRNECYPMGANKNMI